MLFIYAMKKYFILLCVSFRLTTSSDLCDKCECTNEILDCRNHFMQNLKDETTFPGSIRSIYLSGVDLKHLRPSTFNVTNSKAETIDLSANELEEIKGNTFKSFDKLMKLHLRNNKIETIKNNSFKFLSKLSHLDLSYNKIVHIPQDTLVYLKNLTHLSLKYNSIKEISFGLFRESQSLKVLDLSYLILKDLDEECFNWNLTIQKLDLSHNYLNHIPSGIFKYIGETLEELDLSGNLFTTIPGFAFQGSQALQFLILDQLLHLSTIDCYAFASMESLEAIQLRYLPNLKSIDEKAFRLFNSSNETSISYVNVHDFTLSFTTLPVLHSQLLNWEELRQVSLVQNRWVCDCHMAWIKNSTLESLTGITIICAYPEYYKGYSITSLNKDHFICYTTAESKSNYGNVGILLALFFMAFLVALCTIGTLFYRDNGWLLRMPVRFQRLNSQASSITVYDRVDSPSPIYESTTHLPSIPVKD